MGNSVSNVEPSTTTPSTTTPSTTVPSTTAPSTESNDYIIIKQSIQDIQKKFENFKTIESINAFQPKGDYALMSDLSKYQQAGDYALKGELSSYQPKGNYQQAGDYASKGELSNYQPKGNYQQAGNYALKSDLSAFQSKGEYVLKNNTIWCADGDVCQLPAGRKGFTSGEDIILTPKTTVKVNGDANVTGRLDVAGDAQFQGLWAGGNIWTAGQVNSDSVNVRNGVLKLGDTNLSSGSGNWVRLLGDPANEGSYNKGLAADRLWSKGESWIGGQLNASDKIAVGGGGSMVIDKNTINNTSRIHINGSELLYILNKDGVIVGKEGGGNGNLVVQGRLDVKGDAQFQGLWANKDLNLGGNANVGGFLKLGDTHLSPGSGNWVRLLSNPANEGSYNRGLAADRLWSKANTDVGGNLGVNGNIDTNGRIRIGQWYLEDWAGQLRIHRGDISGAPSLILKPDRILQA